MYKLIINNFHKKYEKQYRLDLNLWEEKRKILWIIPYYYYSIRKGNKLEVKYSIYKINEKSSKYFKFKELSKPKLTEDELIFKYNSNIWLVPTNIDISDFLKKK